jgi:hypothetical protein
MKGETAKKWQELCHQAATEQDPIRLLQLVTEINRLLLEKEERLVRQEQEAKKTATEKAA